MIPNMGKSRTKSMVSGVCLKKFNMKGEGIKWAGRKCLLEKLKLKPEALHSQRLDCRENWWVRSQKCGLDNQHQVFVGSGAGCHV